MSGGTRVWTLGELEIGLPEALLTPVIARMCAKGWYERDERRALEAHLAPGDRVLEFGGGAGVLACLAGRRLGPGAVTTVEANPALLPVIADNLARNAVAGVAVIHGAALAAPEAETVTLHVPAAYWAAGTRAAADTRAVTVPAHRADALIAAHGPSVLVVDIEGAEADLFATPLPAGLRLVILELHPGLYPPATIAALFARLAARGFAYQPEGSCGPVVCFQRL